MIRIFQDSEILSLAAAELFVKQAQQSLPKGRFNVALSGGHTPRRAYELMARSPLMDATPWNITQFFWSDERWVPPHDPASNERLVRSLLLDYVPVPEDQIHPFYRPDMDAEQAARSYEVFLRDFFAGESQLFDLVFLGLGKEGHTASLFPDTPVLRERDRWVGHAAVSAQRQARVTLTPEAINRSALVVFLVTGAEKAEIVQQVLEGPHQPEHCPAQSIHPDRGELLWLLDEPASRKLSNPTRLQSETAWR